MKCFNYASRFLSLKLLKSCLVICLLWEPALLHALIIDYSKISPNVPYSEIAKLTSSPHQSIISYGDHGDQKILFWPAEGKKRNNTVIFIHGGCWLADYDIQHSLALTSALAERGFDVYSIEYRRTGNGGEWPVALNDIQLALVHIHEQLASAGEVYQAPISILGHSAGGHLATLAAASLGPTLFADVHLFGLAPIIDLVSYADGENSCQTATPAFMGGTQKEHVQTYKLANPLELRSLLAPTAKSNVALKSAVMMVGTNDVIVPQQMAQHPSAEFIVIDKAGHFDWIHPGSDAFTLLVDKLIAKSVVK